MSSPKVARMWEWQQVKEWQKHNNYDIGTSVTRVVTRSQTPFVIVEHTLANLQVFADPKRQAPPNMPPLMITLKGGYGSIPNTVITRSFGKFLEMDQKLSEELAAYKNYKPEFKKKKGHTIKKQTQQKKNGKKSTSRK